jgi:hypothetical protein
MGRRSGEGGGLGFTGGDKIERKRSQVCRRSARNFTVICRRFQEGAKGDEGGILGLFKGVVDLKNKLGFHADLIGRLEHVVQGRDGVQRRKKRSARWARFISKVREG